MLHTGLIAPISELLERHRKQRPDKIAYWLSDADCRTVITTPARKELIDKLAAGLNGPVSLVFAGAGASEAGLCLDELAQGNQGNAGAALDRDDIDRSSFIIYTSGTTGRAKGVLLSIRGMLWITVACWAPICGLNDNDVV